MPHHIGVCDRTLLVWRRRLPLRAYDPKSVRQA